MDKKIIYINFKNKQDFRARIVDLFINQKDDETYEFGFPDRETEEDFITICKG